MPGSGTAVRLAPVTPTPDDFRALARSSPWRFTRLHFTHRRPGEPDVEAWLQRPGSLTVRVGGGPLMTVVDDNAATETWAGFQEPVRRPDGLVTERPDVPWQHYGDPMHQDYLWCAMLDPVELAAGVEVSDVRAVVQHGRPAWQARCAAREGYDPRCACCPILFSAITQRYEGQPTEGVVFPDAYEVTLDVETAVVVGLAPLGEHSVAARMRFDTEIHAVDE